MFCICSLVCFLNYGVNRRQVLIAKPHFYLFQISRLLFLISNIITLIKINVFKQIRTFNRKPWFWDFKNWFCCLLDFKNWILLSFSKTDSVVLSEKRDVFLRVSPSLGAFGTWWTCPCSDFWFNFARFGSRTKFLKKFLDDSAWFCVERLKKHSFETKKLKNRFRNSKVPPKSWKTSPP